MMTSNSGFLFLICLIYCAFGHSQNDVFAFYEYDIKSGMSDQFTNGYEKDLEWHQSQNDDWSWIGWFVMNGDRRMRFVDATPNHNWVDFDNWKVNRAENSRHNKIHWASYVENLSGSYRVRLDEFSQFEPRWYTGRFIQTYRIEVKNGHSHDFELFLTAFKKILESKLNKFSFVWMKTVSGGAVEEFHLFIAINKMADFHKLEEVFDLSNLEEKWQLLYADTVLRNISELWIYSERLSLLVEKE